MAIFDLTDISNTIQTLSNPYGTPSNSVWNLQRGSFKNSVTGKTCVFFIVPGMDADQSDNLAPMDPLQRTAVEQISDTGGRRLAVYEYPYVDGQSIDDLGRKGEKFNFQVRFYGDNYQVRLKQFLDVVSGAAGQGVLSHPVRGAITARFQDSEIVHRHDEFNSVTLKVTFLEDNTGSIQNKNSNNTSQNTLLRQALQGLVGMEAGVSNGIFTLSALLLLPNAIKNSMQQRLTAISGSISVLLGQLASTFATDAQVQALVAAADRSTGNVTQLNSGTTSTSVIPPVYQVGFSQNDQANINTQLSSFVSSNQVTPQQAVFAANQARAAIEAAIQEIQANTGNQGFSVVMIYRQMANQIQNVTQGCIAAAQPQVVVYTVQTAMSLRMIAFLNGLSPDAQTQIFALNPGLGSANYVPAGTTLLVPAA